MAFLWDNANTGVFYRIGKFIKKIVAYGTRPATTYPADLIEITDPYQSAEMVGQIPGVYDAFSRFQAQDVSTMQSLAGFVNQTIADRTTVLTQIGVITPSLPLILPALFNQAITDGKTFNRCTTTVGSVSTSGNTGTGVVLVTKVLDGFNPPILGAISLLGYNGLSSELTVPSETMTFTCTADSERQQRPSGGESFSWSGGIAGPPFDWRTEGSGQGPLMTVTNAQQNFVANDAFERWSTNTPTSWTIDAGTAGTNIFQETSVVYRGTGSIKFHGDGATATIGIGQSISSNRLVAKRRYLRTLRLRVSAVPAAGTFVCKFTGTGYTAATVTDNIQTLQISGTPTSGTYTITLTGLYGGAQTTAAIAYNATSATVQAAIRLLSGFESVVVATAAGSPPDVTHSITFYGLAGFSPTLACTIASLTGGTPVRTIATVTPGVEGEQINLPAAAFPVANTWVLRHFWVNMPAIIPSDWRLVISIGSTLSNGVNVYVDDGTFSEVVYHGGVGAVIIAGATDFIEGDKMTVAISQDSAGVFQSFFRRWWKVQMPSSGSANVPDSLCA